MSCSPTRIHMSARPCAHTHNHTQAHKHTQAHPNPDPTTSAYTARLGPESGALLPAAAPPKGGPPPPTHRDGGGGLSSRSPLHQKHPELLTSVLDRWRFVVLDRWRFFYPWRYAAGRPPPAPSKAPQHRTETAPAELCRYIPVGFLDSYGP